ncbi:MAG: sugar transferase [Gemmatimonadaceae bacterium]|nr:sugar transferase [Gemmatimonadaceae bacterium]
MSIVPVLLDLHPPYVGPDANGSSLLLLPVAEDVLLREMLASVQRVTAHRPIVLAAFEPDDEYARRIREACPDVDAITSVSRFAATIDRFAPSDSFLFVSPLCYPADGIDLRPLSGAVVNDARMVRHLVAFEAPTLHTKELVQADDDGRVRRIQRYFEPVTWPFPSGVLASMVPVACAQVALPLTLSSLEDLRMQLSSSGIPNQDVPFHGDCFDLADEAGALALSERRVGALAPQRDAARGRPATSAGSRRAASALVHPEARLVGPVVLGEDVEIEAGALIVGPSCIGTGARIAANAVVAQCLVLPGASVTAGTTVRHRVVSGDSRHAAARSGQRRNHAPHLVAVPEGSRRTVPTYVAAKAAVEPVLALLALVALSPLLLLMALMVKLTSRGPVFYGDSREGKDARPFTCWKFRSMLTNADMMQRALAEQQQMDGPQFKMDHDPRVTRAGYWLRRLNVDELPQLWNVVRGEMSLVGPRPSPFRENQICVPWRNGRLSVRPGITGLWQVCRKDRATGDFHQWIHYDLLYVRNVSFRLDMMILGATLLTLGGRKPVPLRLMLGKRKPVRGRRYPVPEPTRFRSPADSLSGSAAR